MTSRPEFAPYRVQDSGRNLDEVVERVNGWIHRETIASRYTQSSIYDFEALLSGLTGIEHLEFVEHWRLLAEPCPPDRIRVGIRHDIDVDIVAAMTMAEIEARHGIVANWVVLHTAAYYGQLANGTFYRNNSMGHAYRRFAELGHEVSLHTDALHLYQRHRIDGATGLVTELEWLRGLGLDIRGTTAHSSRPSYGAENFEVFRGYLSTGKDALGLDVDHVVHQGRYAPLRVLDEERLGLAYEGNQVFWQDHTKLAYGSIRGVDQWRWNAHDRRRRRQPTHLELPFLDQGRMLADIAELELGQYLVLVIHPVYYGARPGPTSPPRRHDRVETVIHPDLGWTTYEPGAYQSASGRPDEQRVQAIHMANALGMLDAPWPERAAGDGTILFLGSDGLDGLAVPVDRQAHRMLAHLAREQAGLELTVAKLAHPGMGADRLWGWFERAGRGLRPDVVVVGISARSPELTTPAIWSRITGFSRKHPPGDYLRWDPDTRSVVEVRRSSQCDLYRRGPRAGLNAQPDRDGTIEVYAELCARIRQTGGRPVLLADGAPDRGLTAAVAERAHAEIVDPRVDSWSTTGHRLAAEALYLALCPAGAWPTRRP